VTTRIHPYGDRALLVEVDSANGALELHAALAATLPDGVVDIVPAARTVTVVIDPHRLPLEVAAAWIERAEPQPADEGDVDTIELDVDYSGEDLREVGRLTGMSVDEVIDLHTSSTWRVAFGGFAPGFGYLVTDHDRLRVPRRAEPRTTVPAGAVALAGEFGGVYPRSGPGGWQLIGHTDAVLWDEERDAPALLRPGTLVRFRRAGAPGAAPGAVPPAAPLSHDLPARDRIESALSNSAASSHYSKVPTRRGGSADLSSRAAGAITIVDPGMQMLIEDLGRPGNASVGAGRSGALDRAALRLGNRLLGNDESVAALELLYGGAQLRFERPTWFAITGARGRLELGSGGEAAGAGGAGPADTEVDDTEVDDTDRAAPADPADGIPRSARRLVEPDTPIRAEAGETLSIGPAEAGMRYVLAVRGGILARDVLGSRSRDTGAGIGPAPLVAGDLVQIAPNPGAGIPPVDALTVPAPPTDTIVVHVRPGPRADWFAAEAITRFYETEWRVSADSDRIGVRLTPPAIRSGDSPYLRRVNSDELPSEAMVPGGIQVPPNGAPVVLLADHPVTGGYPVIAVVADADLDLFAQLRPGQGVRFRHAR